MTRYKASAHDWRKGQNRRANWYSEQKKRKQTYITIETVEINFKSTDKNFKKTENVKKQNVKLKNQKVNHTHFMNIY